MSIYRIPHHQRRLTLALFQYQYSLTRKKVAFPFSQILCLSSVLLLNLFPSHPSPQPPSKPLPLYNPHPLMNPSNPFLLPLPLSLSLPPVLDSMNLPPSLSFPWASSLLDPVLYLLSPGKTPPSSYLSIPSETIYIGHCWGFKETYLYFVRQRGILSYLIRELRWRDLRK